MADGSTAEFAPSAMSRPRQLLASPDVRHLMAVFERLKDAEVSGENGLTSFLDRLLLFSATISERPIPEDFKDDVQEVMDLPVGITEGASTRVDGDIVFDWRTILENLSKLRLSRRLPEVFDRLVPWEYIYPDDLQKEAGIPRKKLKSAMTQAAYVLDLQQVASWSNGEMREAELLIEADEVMRCVRNGMSSLLDDARQTWSFITGSLRLLVPVLLVWLLWSVLNNGAPVAPTAPLSAESLGVMPLYKIGGAAKL